MGQSQHLATPNRGKTFLSQKKGNIMICQALFFLFLLIYSEGSMLNFALNDLAK
jgi:hypothetical protein